MKRALFTLMILSICHLSTAQVWHRYDNLDSLRDLSLRFRTNSPNITVRYCVSEGCSTPHADLFVINNNGVEIPQKSIRRSSSDTLTLSLEGVDYTKFGHKNSGYEFQLWLPQQSLTEWVEVGVESEDCYFNFAQPREESPIVVCSVREDAAQSAGERWIAKLARQMDRPLLDMGGVSEDVTSRVCSIEAKAFVLDGDIKAKSLERAIAQIREAHPTTPILVSQSEVMKRVAKRSIEGVYCISSGEDSASDCANGYESILRDVLHCPKGDISTTIPVSQRRVNSQEWQDHCVAILKELKTTKATCAVMGNSIVQGWGSNSTYTPRVKKSTESWTTYMGDYVNLGLGADRVENLLWRVYNDQMEIKQFEKILIMIGTNNLNSSTSNEDIVTGVANLIDQIKIRQPNAEITLLNILPRKDLSWAELQEINVQYERVAKEREIIYKCVGEALMDDNNLQIQGLFSDRVHLTAKGYMVLGEALTK